MRAPADLQESDCIAGAEPRLRSTPAEEAIYDDKEMLVLGCVTLPSGARLLVIAEARPPERLFGRLACFYTVPEGRRDVDPRCPWVQRRMWKQWRERHDGRGRRVTSPLWGDEGIWLPSVRRVDEDGPIYLFGLASADLDSVIVSYRGHSGARRERPAELIPVSRQIAGQLGGSHPFGYYIGELPPSADTCARITVEARDERDRVVESRSESRFSRERFIRTYPTEPMMLPHKPGCQLSSPVGGEFGRLLLLGLLGVEAVRTWAARLFR